jgi:flagellar biosynthetic protein FliQ
MTIEDFLHISHIGVETAMMVSAPILIAGLSAGVLVSIVQAATQINDASLAFIPKILSVMVALMFFGPWMISQMVGFASYVFNQIPNVTQ